MVASTPHSSMYVSETSLNKWTNEIYPFKFSHIDLDWLDNCHMRWTLCRVIPTSVHHTKPLTTVLEAQKWSWIIFFFYNIHIILTAFAIPYKAGR